MEENERLRFIRPEFLENNKDVQRDFCIFVYQMHTYNILEGASTKSMAWGLPLCCERGSWTEIHKTSAVVPILSVIQFEGIHLTT